VDGEKTQQQNIYQNKDRTRWRVKDAVGIRSSVPVTQSNTFIKQCGIQAAFIGGFPAVPFTTEVLEPCRLPLCSAFTSPSNVCF